MNKKMMLVAAAFAAGLSACNAESAATDSTGDVGSATDDVIVGNSVFFFPGSLNFAGCAATFPVSVVARQPLNFIAVDIAGANSLALRLAQMDMFGNITPLSLIATPIDGALLGTIRASLVPIIPPLATTALFPTTAFVSSLPVPMITNLTTLVGAPATDLAAATAALQIALTPAISANALVFTGLPVLPALSRFVVTTDFNAIAQQRIASLSIFAAAQVQSAVVQSAFFPISTALCAVPNLRLVP